MKQKNTYQQQNWWIRALVLMHSTLENVLVAERDTKDKRLHRPQISSHSSSNRSDLLCQRLGHVQSPAVVMGETIHGLVSCFPVAWQ